MANRTINHIKLGLFVLLGMTLLVVLLYFVGKNRNLFHPSFEIKTHFQNIQGLQPGHNVRYAGIQAGSVKQIVILNDTVIEVTLSIDRDFKTIIRKNALVSIGTDGVVGNKIVNITPVKSPSDFIEDQDLLDSKKALETDVMIKTLNSTNENIADITEQVKDLLSKINQNQKLTQLLTTDEVPNNVITTLNHLRRAAIHLSASTQSIHSMVDSVQTGHGSIGAMLTDTIIYDNLVSASDGIKQLTQDARRLTDQLQHIVATVSENINRDQGTAHLLLRDTVLAVTLQRTVDNLEEGTARFSQDMEALKSNFLFRKYFKKQARRDSLEAKKSKN